MIWSQISPATVHINTWLPSAVSLPWLTESRQSVQVGPKQSLLPNSTKTPSPTRGWEVLPRTVPRGASSQGPGHRVMGRRDLSGDDRPWGKAPDERLYTGVRQDTPESDTINKSRAGHFRKDRLNMTLPEKEPCLTPFLSSSSSSVCLPQATWDFRGQSKKLQTCCLRLRMNIPPSLCHNHRGESLPGGTESSAAHCNRRDSWQSTPTRSPTQCFSSHFP